MRLFIGIELDEPVRAAAASLAAALRAQIERTGVSGRVRWVPHENLHITLSFLGEVADPRAPEIVAAMSEPFDVAAFAVGVGGFGAFPPSGPLRVFWLGVGPGAEGVLAIYERIVRRLRPLGFEPERRPYHAHVTMARLGEAPGGKGSAAVRQMLRDRPAEAGSFRVERVTVFRSRLSANGAAYEAMLRVPLS